MTGEEVKSPYQIDQEFKKEEIKKLTELKIILHPAGGFDKKSGFVYEPVGNHKYIFKFRGYKGLVDADLFEKIECGKCGVMIMHRGKKKTAKCSCGNMIDNLNPKWTLITEFSDLDLKFDGVPLNKLMFKVPDEDAINYWLNNPSNLTRTDIVNMIKNFFKIHFDFPFPEKEPSILALAVIQSWLREILNTMFYVSMSGPTGSGKTVLGEAVMMLSRHGLMASTISPTAIARVIEKYQTSLFFDEIDNKKRRDDEDIFGVLRQGYRKNNPFIKLNPHTFEPEIYDPYGFKAFSFRSEVVDDLQNRSIDTTLSKTKSKELPVLNSHKEFNCPFNELFFWYLDNIVEIYIKSPIFREEQVNTVNEINKVKVNINNNISLDIEETRKGLVQEIGFLPNFINLVNQKEIFGRNIEIAYIIYSLCQIMGIDMDSLLVDIMEEKAQTEEAYEEEGWSGILKDVLISEYPGVIKGEDASVVTYKSIIAKYAQKMRETYEIVPSQYQIKRLLRQIGFVDGLNKKVMKRDKRASLCLIYDSEIKKKIGIEIKKATEEKT